MLERDVRKGLLTIGNHAYGVSLVPQQDNGDSEHMVMKDIADSMYKRQSI